jgi:hypothetical protein
MDLVLAAVRRRIDQLDLETELIREQLTLIPNLKHFANLDYTILSARHNILSILHSMYVAYFEGMNAAYSSSCSFVKFLHCHLRVLSQPAFTNHFDELSSIQDSLERLTNLSLATRESDLDSLADALNLFFPYKSLFDNIIFNRTRFSELLRIISSYSPEKYRDALVAVSRLITPITPDKHVVLAVAESVLLFFVRNTVRVGFVKDFEFLQRTLSLLQDRLSKLNIESQFRESIGKSSIHIPHVRSLKQLLPRPLLFRADAPSVMLRFRHVVLELRKLPTQVSVTGMGHSLLRAVVWLFAELAKGETQAGGDDSLDYFVGCVAEATLCHLPSILATFEAFLIDDLKSSKTNFVVHLLKVACGFIESEGLEVPPVVFLPFPTTSQTQIRIPGFATYAFPLFVKSSAPAAICYSGRESDCAVLYAAQEAPAEIIADRLYGAIATIHGSLLFVSEEAVDRHDLIRVDCRPFADAAEEIALVSNLLAMGVRVGRPATSVIPALLKKFVEEWGVPSHAARPSAFELIADIQAALIARRLLRDGYVAGGWLDWETMEGIQAAVKSKGRRPFVDQKVYALICDLTGHR